MSHFKCEMKGRKEERKKEERGRGREGRGRRRDIEAYRKTPVLSESDGF